MRNYENPLVTSENRMNPRSYYIPEGVSELQMLNGEWSFKYYKRDIDVKDEIADWDKIMVPSCWQLQGYDDLNYTNINYPYPVDPPYVPDDNPCGVYQREFDIKKVWGKIYFVLEGVSSCAYIYVNKEYVGFTQGSHLQAEFDITKFVTKGTNTIQVRVLKWCCGSYLEDQDFLRYNGIFRDCYILQRPKDHIEDVRILSDAEKISVDVGKEADIALLDAEENVLQLERNACNVEWKIENPILWNAEKPYSYTIKIKRNGEEIVQKTGMRSIAISEKSELLINGVPVKLHGVNHHDTDPKTGWYQTPEALVKDLKLMKELNINCIRTSHYPPTPHMIELCDEMGFYVILENDMETHGFRMRNPNEEDRYDIETGEWPCQRAEWKKEMVERMQRTVMRDKNHTSVIMWSLGNESAFGENMKEMVRFIRTQKDCRLIHSEDASRLGESDYVDVHSTMYHSLEEVEAFFKTGSKQPYFFCEYCHAMGNGPGDIYDYNELIHATPQMIGGCVWEWADHVVLDEKGVQRYGGDFQNEKTHDSNFCCDGMVFSDRSIRSGSLEVKTAYQPMVTQYENGVLTVTNTYDFTNMEDCEFTYEIQADGETIVFRTMKLAIEPHESLKLNIDVPKVEYQYGLYLNCRLYKDGKEYAVTQHKLADTPARQKSDEAAVQAVYEGENVVITGEHFRYVFSRHYGTFTSMKINGKEQLAGPMRLTAWRAPTDNDCNAQLEWGGLESYRQNGRSENLDKQFSKIYDCEIKDGRIIVKGALAGVARRPFFKYMMSVNVTKDGRIDILLEGNVHERTKYLPRLGFEFDIPESNAAFTYYGRGEGETYCDECHYATIGMYESNAEKEYVHYVRPQEHGNHIDVKMLKIGNLKFETEKTFECKVSQYSTEVLTRAQHTDELIKDGKTHVRVDYKVSGVGSNACGPFLAEKYQLNDKQICFEVEISPDEHYE